MAKTLETAVYVVLRPLQHDKVTFAVGEGIELTEKQAAHLIETQAIGIPGASVVLVAKNSDDDTDAPVALERMNKAALVAHAAEVHGLELKETSGRPELIAAIEEARANGVTA